MPHTVRRRTCPASPAASPQKVRNDGAVKHGRSAPSSTASEAGRVTPGSIGGSPQHEADMHTADASPPAPPRHPLTRAADILSGIRKHVRCNKRWSSQKRETPVACRLREMSAGPDIIERKIKKDHSAEREVVSRGAEAAPTKWNQDRPQRSHRLQPQVRPSESPWPRSPRGSTTS